MMFPDFTELERLRYRQGQRLQSRDFRDQAAIDAQLRWWHNRALHNAYGIARGLEPTLSENDGVVHIASGVAYDCYGRELTVRREWTVRVPDANENLTLLLRYRRNPSDTNHHDVGKAAASSAVTEFVWMRTTGLTFKDGVPVCRIPYETTMAMVVPREMAKLMKRVLPGKSRYAKKALVLRGVLSRTDRDALLNLPFEKEATVATLDVGVYRRAIFDLFERSQIDYARIKGHLLARPRVAAGATVPGATLWLPWLESNRTLIGLQVQIDTSMAAFSETPCYFASLQGLPASGTSFGTASFAHTDSASSTGFVFRFWMTILKQPLVFEKDQEGALLTIAQRLKLFVRWWAIQSEAVIANQVMV